MSVNIGKLNKGGLGSTSFGTNKKTTGLSSQAAKNLSGSSSATKSSVFQFGRAKRSNFVPGQHVRKDMSKYDFSGTRARLNAGVGATSRASYTSSIGNVGTTTYTVNNNTSYQKGMVVGQILNGTFGLLNQLGVFGGNNNGSSSLSDRIDSALSGLGNSSSGKVSSDISGSVSAMSSATDSASLREAIGTADSQLTAMNAKTPGLQSAATTAEKNLKDLETTVKQKENGVTDAKQKLTNAKNTVTSKTNIRDTKKLALEKADANYAAKSEALTQAKENTATAQAALDNANAMPDQVPDGNGGMKKNEAKQKAIQDAKAQLQTAQKAEKAAEDAKTQAKQQAEAAGKDVEKAEQELKTAEKAVKDAETKQKTAEETLKKAESELEKAKADAADAKCAIETFKQHKQDVKELSDNITKQKERLTKLENEEIKNYQKYDGKAQDGLNKANKLAGKIQDDVDTRSERRASKGIDKANDKTETALDKRNSLQGNVDKTYAINELYKQSPVATINGEQYRKGTNPVTGNTVYMRGVEIIDEDTYKKAVGVSS